MFIKKYAALYKFRNYFFRHKGLIALLFCCMVIGSSMGVVLSYVTSLLVISISDANLNGMIRFMLMCLGVVTVHHITWYLWSKLDSLLGNVVAREMRHDIFADILKTKYLSIQSNSLGYYIERINDDTAEVSSFLQNVLGTSVDVVTNFTFLVIVIIQNWYCGLLFSVGLVLLYGLDLIKIRVELKHTKKIKILNEELNSSLTEAIRGVKDIKTLGMRDKTEARNDEISRKLAEQSAKMKSEVVFWERMRTYTQWLIDSALVLMAAIWLFPEGKITAVIILIIFNYKGLVYETVGYFSKMKGYYIQGNYRAGRILEVIEGVNSDKFGTCNISVKEARMEIKNLSYGYDENDVLNNVSFTLEPHTANLLSGVSGSGKSTLFGLLSGLYRAEDGCIFINGTDINKLSEESLRGVISTVNQEPYFFNDTIMNNLKAVRTDADNDTVYECCRKANIYDEISAMPMRFDTVLTDSGENLSGGQRRRLAVARALIKGTSVILFDEPTSALDAENRASIMKEIIRLRDNHTVFVISHNDEHTEMFDNTYRLVSGSLIKD